jgi:hypothetical protein
MPEQHRSGAGRALVDREDVFVCHLLASLPPVRDRSSARLLFDDAEHRFEHYAPKPVSCQQHRPIKPVKRSSTGPGKAGELGERGLTRGAAFRYHPRSRLRRMVGLAFNAAAAAAIRARERHDPLSSAASSGADLEQRLAADRARPRK